MGDVVPIGAVRFAPDYQSVTARLGLPRDARFIDGVITKILNLKPGQTLKVTMTEHGYVTFVEDVAGEPD